MFRLWTCLSLIYVLQNSVSSDQVVSLTCNQTINVTVGDSGTLQCFLKSALEGEEKCTILDHDWCNMNGTELCNRSSTKYICDSDLSYVSLTILNVQEEESFTAEIVSNCGMAKSHPIRVQLDYSGTNPPEPIEQKEESAHVTTITLCVFASVAAVVILYFLYRTYRHRVNGRTYAAPRSEDSV